MKLAILRENHLQALKALRRFLVICQEGGKNVGCTPESWHWSRPKDLTMNYYPP